MRVLAVFGIKIDKSLFGKCSKSALDSLGPITASFMTRSWSTNNELANIYGEGYFEPYDEVYLWNTEMAFSLVVLDPDDYCYKVRLGEVISVKHSELVRDYYIYDDEEFSISSKSNIKDVIYHAVVFGYALPENQDLIDLCIHDEDGEFIFHIADGFDRKIIKLPPLAIIIPEKDVDTVTRINNERFLAKAKEGLSDEAWERAFKSK